MFSAITIVQTVYGNNAQILKPILFSDKFTLEFGLLIEFIRRIT